MGRKATGQIIERKGRNGTVYALRFRAYGERRSITLGATSEGWTRKRAESELANVMADVRRGLWRSPEHETTPTPQEEPGFHKFASDWFARRELEGLRPRTLEYLKWALSDHLLPYFQHHKLSAITVQEIDRYAASAVAEGRLANSSINKTLSVLGALLELAVEYGYLTSNPARGRRRRLPVHTPSRAYLEPDQVGVLLVAAAELDARDQRGSPFRRPLLATLAYAGLRIGELLSLRWGDVDLAAGALHVRASKTDAGVRRVDVQPELREELAVWRSQTRFDDAKAFVFTTTTGNPQNRNNVRRRVLLRAAARANERLAKERRTDLLPEGLSPHALRRSFASWLIAEGEDVAYVMGQLGHTDPKMTLGLYAKALRSKRRRSDLGTESLGQAEIAQTAKTSVRAAEAALPVNSLTR